MYDKGNQRNYTNFSCESPEEINIVSSALMNKVNHGLGSCMGEAMALQAQITQAVISSLWTN